MGRIVFGIIAVIAFFVLADSLTCNKCSVGLVGYCLNSAEETCATNTSLCFTSKAVFPNITAFVGFNTQGCKEAAGCNITETGTLLGGGYEVSTSCCDADKCNPVVLGGAPSRRSSLSVALGAAAVAFVLGSARF